MQFPNPIVTSLIIYDNLGRPVVIIGPGPSLVIQGTNSSIEFSIDNVSGVAQQIFWNFDKSNNVDFNLYNATTHNEIGWIAQGGNFTRGALSYYGFFQFDTPSGSTEIGVIRSDTRVETTNAIFTEKTIFIQAGDGTGLNGPMLAFDASSAIFKNSINADGVGYSKATTYFTRTGTNANWIGFTYANGWSDLGGNWETGAYKITPDGWVTFKGVIIGGTKVDGTVLFTLPAAVRPTLDQILTVAMISAGAGSNINLRVFAATGQCQCFGIAGSANGNMSLNSARYPLV